MSLGITAADLTREGLREMTRRVVVDVPQWPSAGEVSWTTETRDLTHYLLEISGCTRWDAVTVAPMYRVTYLPREYDQVVTLDDRFLIVARRSEPVAAQVRYSITVNGRPIPHRVLTPGGHGINDVVTSVWRHLNLVGHTACDAEACTAQPLFALVAGGAYCAMHVDAIHR